jgi:hypothetical protein
MIMIKFKSISHHGFFVLKAFEDEVTLLIFEFFNLIVSSHIIILQCAELFRISPVVFGMEHMGAQIQHSPLINFIVFIQGGRLARVLFDKLGNLIAESARLKD